MHEEFYLKVHKINHDILVAICDKEYLNCSFNHNGVRIRVSEYFYGNISYTANEVIKKVRKATQINAIGKKIVDLLTSNMFISVESILWMKDDVGGKIGHIITLGETGE